MFGNQWHKKEKPLPTLIGLFGGATSLIHTVSGGPFQATGGDIADGITPGNGYKYHTFGSPGNFTVTQGGVVDFLVVGGGGAGVGYGGGGAGGCIYGVDQDVPSGTHAIVVGDGGDRSAPTVGEGNGSDSELGTLVTGGGGGCSQELLYPNMAGQPGGSGGGGEGSNSPGDPGGEGVSPGNLNGGTWYGNDGGSGGPRASGGGGGGASTAGVPNPTMTTSNSGGEGERFQPFAYSLAFPSPYHPNLDPWSPTGDHYGGGGGGSESEDSNRYAGGVGGGGDSGKSPPSPGANRGVDGADYLGGGGGGANTTSGVGGVPGGDGGKGVVIIRYLEVLT